MVGVGSDNESRKEVRRIPLFRLITWPSGLTTVSFAVKSVSAEVDWAQSRTVTGPVTSVSWSSWRAAVDQDVGSLLDG